MNKDEQIEVIYRRFLQNAATRNELQQLFHFIEHSTEPELKRLLAEALGNPDFASSAEENIALLQNVRAKIMHEVKKEGSPIRRLRSGSYKVWYAAASLALLISVAGIFMLSKKASRNHTSDLRAGGNIAMLSVGGADTIKLLPANAEGMLKKTAGVAIAKTSDGTITYTAYGTDTLALSQTNTLITPRGGQYHVRLTDGTEVLLNSESKLQFPVGFTGNERRVVLTGEAYFEVAKNKHKPFIVTTGKQNIQVLGTKFNVSNYVEDDGPVTTLTEGSVKVTTSLAQAMLKPGQQSHATAAGIIVNNVDTELYSAWKNGDFVFEDAPLEVIMHKLSRWYNFETDYSKLPQKKLYMKISKQVNLSEVLGMITTTSGIKFKIDDRRVTVM